LVLFGVRAEGYNRTLTGRDAREVVRQGGMAMADGTRTQITSTPGEPAPGKTPVRNRTRGRVWRVLGGLVLAVLLGGSALLWMERDPLRAWLYVRNLSAANDDGARQRWAGYVADLGEPAVPGLCACLHQDDPNVCHNAQVGLAALADHWGRGDARSATLLQTLAREYKDFSLQGQRQTLDLATRWFSGEDASPTEDPLVPAGARLLAETTAVTDPEVHAAALNLAAVLRSRGPVALAAARDLVSVSLRASTPALRARAIQLTLPDKDHQVPDMDLQVQVANLLVDSDVEVRRNAIVAVGGEENTKVLTETLLPCLRDPDPEVRQQCQKGLTSRGLSPAHIRLAYVLTDPDPRERLKVLDLIQDRDMQDLVDPADWLRRLSHDPAPSVRAAAARVMADYRATDMTDRLAQMARSDPMDSVRRLAEYYLRCALRQSPRSGALEKRIWYRLAVR
jgi:hypothetical protein